MSEISKQILSDHKVSITNPRILVLEALLDSKNPLTIDELQSKLSGNVAKSTLYRVLNDLKKIKILHEFTSPDNSTVVELLLEDHSHHHHLFCSDCGEIIDVEMSSEFENLLDKEIKKIEKQFNFVIQDHRVEMFGVCTDQCANCK
uniref:Fe2+/Zn2+ uptake regulation proteins n=1 Tax=Candidatus Actinomarina minuta TaxID=1389454 RepID=S5DJI5_9ACTN|nr:Fe2+/Zn2+ uptake regulation proteins [Candidatus Actinomarina minuta]|tara:strand:- start:1025 stop:1462 length:438 start_codon:yes stop_codon:yes gene_type:complete